MIQRLIITHDDGREITHRQGRVHQVLREILLQFFLEKRLPS